MIAEGDHPLAGGECSRSEQRGAAGPPIRQTKFAEPTEGRLIGGPKGRPDLRSGPNLRFGGASPPFFLRKKYPPPAFGGQKQQNSGRRGFFAAISLQFLAQEGCEAAFVCENAAKWSGRTRGKTFWAAFYDRRCLKL